MPLNSSNSRAQNLSLVVVISHEGVVAHNVILGAHNTDKSFEFIHTKVIPSLERQRFVLMNNVPFHRFRAIQQAFEDVGHIKSHVQTERSPKSSNIIRSRQ
jgi:hypothetical protein